MATLGMLSEAVNLSSGAFDSHLSPHLLLSALRRRAGSTTGDGQVSRKMTWPRRHIRLRRNMDQLTQVVTFSVKDGDVLFVDAEAIDVDRLMDSLRRYTPLDRAFYIVPVITQGRPVAEFLAVGRKEDLTQETK